MNFSAFVVSIDKLVTICTIQDRRRYIYDKANFNFFYHRSVGEGKWHLVPSYEDATILILSCSQNY